MGATVFWRTTPFLTQVSASSNVGVLGFHAVLDVVELAAIWWPTLVK